MKKFIGLILIAFSVYLGYETWIKVEPLLEKYQGGITSLPVISVMVVTAYTIGILVILIAGFRLFFSKA